jgi:hypothetical protein
MALSSSTSIPVFSGMDLAMEPIFPICSSAGMVNLGLAMDIMIVSSLFPGSQALKTVSLLGKSGIQKQVYAGNSRPSRTFPSKSKTWLSIISFALFESFFPMAARVFFQFSTVPRR